MISQIYCKKMMNPAFVFLAVWVGPVIGYNGYRYHKHQKRVMDTHNKLDYLQVTDRCLEDVKQFRKDLAQCDTRGETEAYCDLVDRLYTNCMTKNRCET